MMIKSLKYALFSAMLVSSVTVSAQSAGFAGPKNIVGLDIGDSSELNIRFDSNTYCGSPFVSVSRSMPYYNDMLAMALTAQASNKPINVYISGCNTGSEPRIVRLVIGTVF